MRQALFIFTYSTTKADKGKYGRQKNLTQNEHLPCICVVLVKTITKNNKYFKKIFVCELIHTFANLFFQRHLD
jgi:hypothetical protein